MASTAPYNNDTRQSSIDVEFAADPASGSFFSSEFKKHEDLKQMLDSSKDGLKLEAMKRIIGMVAKGKDASELFPAVVKNVVSSNLEVKKLVYVYLVRYAEEQQDLALLSISTFQRGLKDPNPLIRACALRVLSSIRVLVIVPIMLLAIKETVTDLSPYVRKTTSHAIPKLYSLDPEQKEELVKVIEKLLSDMSTLVVGSAVMAFEEVCPERIDLIHTNYRKLCCLLVDVEEWGQIIIINMLTRYSRTQFLDPNTGKISEDEDDAPFYQDNVIIKEAPRMDQDHRLLLSNTKPLLQSRNAAVVLSVAQLYQHIAPKVEVNQVARALVRLLRSHREVQAVVLTNIATLSTQRKGMFEPFLKSFFVRSCDPTQIKILKLEVMTNLATEANIALILREFQTYIWSSDKEFVAATIQAIGRCASSIKEVTDSCLNGLVMLLSNKDELVVGESVVVVRKLLQSETVGHQDIITHMARLVDNIKMPTARASILWLLGEYCDKVPKIAPDVLRKMAKSFINEADIVKLQIITLATKLYLTNAKQTHLLCQYVFNLAKYDTNYDIRDRARFIRALIFPSTESNKLARQAKKIFLASKPPPIQYSNFKDRDQYQLGTLSHLINARASGYCDLPSFPEVAPDSSVRNLKKEMPTVKKSASWVKQGKSKDKGALSSDGEEESSFESDSEDDSSSDSEGTEDSSSSSDDSDNDDSKDSETEEETKKSISGDRLSNRLDGVSSSSSSSNASSSSSSEDDSSTSDSVEPDSVHADSLSRPPKSAEKGPPSKSNLDLLLDLEDVPLTIETPILTPSIGGFLTPSLAPGDAPPPIPGASIRRASPVFIPTKTTEVLNRISGCGLSVEARFTRSVHLYSPSMTSLELTFKNTGSEELSGVCVGAKRLAPEMAMHDFALIPSLAPGVTLYGTVGIDFNDSITPAAFDIVVGDKNFPVSITPAIGELIHPVFVSEADFNHFQSQLRGMNEHSGFVLVSTLLANDQLLKDKLYQCVNLLQVPSNDEDLLKFGGQMTSSKSLVLVTIHQNHVNEKTKITINCEKVVVASILFKQIETALSK